MTKQAERDFALKVDPRILYRKPFNDPRTYREFALVLEIFRRHIPRGRVLDMGCGPGWTSLFLARAGFDVVGMDISEKMIEVARDRGALENCPATFHIADMEYFDLGKGTFSGVLFFDCLHHCPQYQKVLHNAYDHLRPGGIIFLMETTWLHRYSPQAHDATRDYGLTELGFTRPQLRRALKAAGFRNLRQYHDPGPGYRGLGGFLWTTLRLCVDFVTAFPQAKNIFLAEK